MESYDNKWVNCSKYISLTICVKKEFFNELIFVLLSKIWRIFYENHGKEIYSLTNKFSDEHIFYTVRNVNILIIVKA